MGVGVTAVVVLVVVVLTWAAFWAALAANVGMSRGAPAGFGLRWGFLLGPIGLGIVVARTRGGGRGLDERVASGKQIAGRYADRARRSAEAWRGPSVPDPAAGSGRPPPGAVPPPRWGPPSAIPGSSGIGAPPVGGPSAAPPAAGAPEGLPGETGRHRSF